MQIRVFSLMLRSCSGPREAGICFTSRGAGRILGPGVKLNENAALTLFTKKDLSHFISKGKDRVEGMIGGFPGEPGSFSLAKLKGAARETFVGDNIAIDGIVSIEGSTIEGGSLISGDFPGGMFPNRPAGLQTSTRISFSRIGWGNAVWGSEVSFSEVSGKMGHWGQHEGNNFTRLVDTRLFNTSLLGRFDLIRCELFCSRVPNDADMPHFLMGERYSYNFRKA